MENFKIDDLGKKFKNNNTGEIAYFVGRFEGPSATLRKENGEKINFGIGSMEQLNWEIYKEADLTIDEPNTLGNIEFSTPKCENIIKLCANGDIFVKGILVENDKEVVDGMRLFLEQDGLSIPKKMHEEKEFNLSERIEQLKKELKDNAKLNDVQIDGIIRMIEFMDREFIKRLKAVNLILRKDKQHMISEIDKLVGDKLI